MSKSMRWRKDSLKEEDKKISVCNREQFEVVIKLVIKFMSRLDLCRRFSSIDPCLSLGSFLLRTPSC